VGVAGRKRKRAATLMARRGKSFISGACENFEAADPHLSSPLQGEEEPSRARERHFLLSCRDSNVLAGREGCQRA
jgi:hypothetical protein